MLLTLVSTGEGRIPAQRSFLKNPSKAGKGENKSKEYIRIDEKSCWINTESKESSCAVPRRLRFRAAAKHQFALVEAAPAWAEPIKTDSAPDVTYLHGCRADYMPRFDDHSPDGWAVMGDKQPSLCQSPEHFPISFSQQSLKYGLCNIITRSV